ncbi:MAG: FHA domain-containing protein [Clostridium sp.]|nr:FHA domain-containing protein [Clostridium sp.]
MIGKKDGIKEIKKSGMTQIVVKIAKEQMLSDREIYAINHHEIGGLLAIDVIRKPGSFKLIYHLTGLISLEDFLLTPMSRDVFGILLRNILHVLKELQKMHFNQQALVMDLDKVMVNPVKQELLFVYLPIQGYANDASLKDFLLEIIRRGSFEKEEDDHYVQEYIRILKGRSLFSLFELEVYLEAFISGNRQIAVHDRACPICGAPMTGNSTICYRCGGRKDEIEETKKKERIYDPIPPQRQKEQETATVQRRLPVLIRERTSERIVIDTEKFCIGRSEKYCDYVISDNAMVGRQHAVILHIEGKYYIEDLQSTNKTFVNGREIRKEELISGARIRLADEKFIFMENL